MYGRAMLTFTYMTNPLKTPPLMSSLPKCCLTGPNFLPRACVEVLKDYVTNHYKVRRLHLIVVDLWRPWRYNARQAKNITDQLWYLQDRPATHRMVPLMPCGPETPLRCRRYVYGYALVTWSGRSGIKTDSIISLIRPRMMPCLWKRILSSGRWVSSTLRRLCV